MKTTKDIQDLINAKAKARLDADITTLHRMVSNGNNHKLLKDVKVNVGTEDEPQMESLHWIFSDKACGKAIVEANLQRYIEEETKAFMEKVESLRDDVDHLLNVVGQ